MFRSILKPEKLYSVHAQIREKKQAEKVKETEEEKRNRRRLKRNRRR